MACMNEVHPDTRTTLGGGLQAHLLMTVNPFMHQWPCECITWMRGRISFLIECSQTNRGETLAPSLQSPLDNDGAAGTIRNKCQISIKEQIRKGGPETPLGNYIFNELFFEKQRGTKFDRFSLLTSACHSPTCA